LLEARAAGSMPSSTRWAARACRARFHALKPGGMLVAFGFQNEVLGRGGSIPMDFVKLKLWDWLPNGHATAFYSIGAMRRKHPDWFREDLATLFDMLQEGRIAPSSPRSCRCRRCGARMNGSRRARSRETRVEGDGPMRTGIIARGSPWSRPSRPRPQAQSETLLTDVTIVDVTEGTLTPASPC
jgi:hypothetical protein